MQRSTLVTASVIIDFMIINIIVQFKSANGLICNTLSYHSFVFFLLLQDSKMLSEQNKTGIEPPSDFQFEEYGKAQTLNKPSQGLSKEKKKKGFGNLLRKQKKVSDLWQRISH